MCRETARLLTRCSMFLREMTSWLPSWKYDVISEICLVNRCAFSWRTFLLTFVVSNRIRMKFSRIVLQVNTHRLSWIFDKTSYFQDDCHDVRSHAAASAGCPLARRARVTSLARCIYWSRNSTFVPVKKVRKMCCFLLEMPPKCVCRQDSIRLLGELAAFDYGGAGRR